MPGQTRHDNSGGGDRNPCGSAMTIRASTIVTAFAFWGVRGRSHLGERVGKDLPLSRCGMKCMDPVAISWLQDDAEGARL